MATAIPSYTTTSRHCQQLADSPAPSPGPSSTVREWSLGHFPPPGKPKRWGRPIGINGLRTRCPSCGHHAEGFAPADGSSSGPSSGPSGATPAPAVRQPHLPVGLDEARRRWEALPLTREGS